MTGEIQDGEAYSYGNRICKVNPFVLEDVNSDLLIPSLLGVVDQKILTLDYSNSFFNQMELMIWTYKNKGHRNNQMILQIGQPSDMLLKDPPCLRHIDTRIQDGKLHFFPYFRSWDLWGGFPANLAAIELMKQYCAAEIGVENGEIIASSKGAHIYDYVVDLAGMIRGKTYQEFKAESELIHEENQNNR